MFEAAGLTDFEERLYRELLRRQRRSAAQLAAGLGVSAPRVRRALAALQEAGLVYRSEPGRWAPVRPSAGVTALITRRQSELDQIRGTVEQLESEWSRNVTTLPSGELFQVLEGSAAMAERARAMYHEANEQVRILDTPPYTLSSPDFDEVGEEGTALRRLRMRVIYSPKALELPGRLDSVLALSELGEESRFLPDLTVKLTIVDDRMAMIPLAGGPDRIDSALAIGPSALLDSLIALFEAYWSAAVPFAAAATTALPADSPDLSPTDRKILTLLSTGLTDDTIARRLQLSHRTTRRRIYDLMRRLDSSSTRFQAGVQAARRGWL